MCVLVFLALGLWMSCSFLGSLVAQSRALAGTSPGEMWVGLCAPGAWTVKSPSHTQPHPVGPQSFRWSGEGQRGGLRAPRKGDGKVA